MRNYLSLNTEREVLNSMFNEFFKPVAYSRNYLMATDVVQNEKGMELAIEMAGFSKEQINVSYDKGYLTISAKRDETQAKEGESVVRRERVTELSRTFYVGEVNEDAIKAKCENGLLTVILPKKEKQQTVRNILID